MELKVKFYTKNTTFAEANVFESHWCADKNKATND